MNDDSRVKLCFPEPPTPTNKEWPLGVLITREIFTKFVMASRQVIIYFVAVYSTKHVVPYIFLYKGFNKITLDKLLYIL
jgi:hypothetical protein